MPYALSPARMDKYRGWFLGAEVRVSALPSYAVEVASNPFVAFSELPLDSRYRFLLDEAQFFIMNFIKGPVCRGQMAVDVIEDQFWVVFVDPKANAEAIQRRRAAAPGGAADAAGRDGQRFGPARAVAEDGAPGAQLPADQEPGAAARASTAGRPSSTCR